jgi:hypothetical protein
MKKIDFDLYASERAGDLLNKDREKEAAKEYKYVPIEAVTITQLSINMNDDYNGEVDITLSNGDNIFYECIETRTPRHKGDVRPYYLVELSINNELKIEGYSLMDNFGSGTWVNDIMNLYEKLKNK